MSKYRSASHTKKKHLKQLKRKHKSINTYKLLKTPEERLAYKIKMAINNPHSRGYTVIPVNELVADSKSGLFQLANLHYYLVYAKWLTEVNAIEGKIYYDVKKNTLIIRSIAEAIKNIPLLEEDEIAVQTELFDVGERLLSLSNSIRGLIEKLTPIQKQIRAITLKMAELLPEKENGTQRTPEQAIDEVIRINAFKYITDNVYGGVIQ